MDLLEQIDKNQIRDVISYSQDIENPKIDELISDWAKAKTVIADKFFNGKVSYTYPDIVRFELNKIAKGDKIAHFIEYIAHLFEDWHHPLCIFLEAIPINDFYNNSLSFDYTITNRDNKKILKGTKVVKAFKYFIDDEILLYSLQNKASEIIQENKIEGYLTFSIHPLDFLSSSENTHNWRSCHALDGEYRAGNLSYMCDSSTVIVFLSSQKEEHLPHFPYSVPWNNKKWRVLLHFDTYLEVCFAGRQYPFFTQGGLEKINEIFCNKMAGFEYSWLGQYNGGKREKWSKWYNDYIENILRADTTEEHIDDNRYCIINKGIFDRFNIVHDAEGSKHFNDVLRSSCYEKPYYMFKEYYGPQNEIRFEIGAAVSCLYCGEQLIKGDDTMMCPECECQYGNSDYEEYRACSCCGTMFYEEDGYWVNDDYVCPTCADRETFICDICGERYYNDEQHWDEKIRGYICNQCYNERNEEDG